MRRPIRQRGSAHESQTWWRGFFGEGFFCELRLYGQTSPLIARRMRAAKLAVKRDAVA
jgi:hypothetical protein